ncbi:MAG TPA: YcxB family protein [Candidatus Baltobacteraceae bacterium]|jgi:hypothetical protein|nr:YcxB family protein [Candidatus Baltobacteraceae bacterium]
MEFTYQVTLEDLMQFGEHVYRTSNRIRREKRFWCVVIPSLFAAGALDYYWHYRAFDWILILIISQAVCSTVFLPRFFDRSSLRQVYRSYVTKPEASDVGTSRLVITNDSVTEIVSTRQTKVDWRDICKVETLEGRTYVYNSSQSAIIIPRRGFACDRAYEDLLAEISNRLPRGDTQP